MPKISELPSGSAATGTELIPAVQSGATVKLTLAKVATTASASDLTGGTLPAAQMPALTGDITTVAGSVATTLGKTHLVTYTVAPSTASASDKLRADFVGNGVNDQTAINAAIAAAGVSNSKVVALAGVYFLTGPITITNANNFALDCSGAIFVGPVGTADAVVIDGAVNGSTFLFGNINTNTTGAAIHMKATSGAINNAFVRWGKLNGTGGTHVGKGVWLDAATGPMTVNYYEGGWISGFDKGVVMDASGTTNYIDTTRVKSTFIFDCNVDIYGRSGTARRNNSCIWDVNVDAWINGGVCVDIDHSFDVFNIIWGNAAPNTATTFLLKLQAGATSNRFNGTPNLYVSFGASQVSDLSGNNTNMVDGSVSLDAAANGLTQLVKFDGAKYGELQRTGIVLNTTGAINTIPYFSTTGTLTGLATANSGVLVTSAGGIPSISSTLPTGLAIGTPASGVATNLTGLPISTGLTGAGTGVLTAMGNASNAAGGIVLYDGSAGNPQIANSTSPTGGGRIGFNAGTLNYGDGVANHTLVSTDQAQPLLGKISVLVSFPTNGSLGYSTGAGGTVAQATSKATGVTLNTSSGAITMNNAALAGATIVSFVLADSAIAATDVLILNHISGGTPGSYSLNARCAAGSATIDVRNNTAGSLSETIIIQFALIKGVNA